MIRLKDYFTRRFEGGLANVKAGKIKPKGMEIYPGVKLSSIDIVKKTIEWLRDNKKTAPDFFKEVWSASKAVTLGEMHRTKVHSQFAADMLADLGSDNTGLAIEIPISQQPELDYFREHGKPPQDAKGVWAKDPGFHKILMAAKRSNTQVIAMDVLRSMGRDIHMAERVLKLLESKSKVMVYVGAMHAKEAVTSRMGGILAKTLGVSNYTIDMFSPGKRDYIFWMIKEAFPREKSMGFDIDQSPLKSHPDKDYVKYTLGRNNDGYIYFQNYSSYK